MDAVRAFMLERLSVEVTNQCGKGCAFCYSASSPAGATAWTTDDLVALAVDVAAHGVRAISFGGGEPLEFAGIFMLLERTRGVLFRSMTTNGLHLDRHLDALVETGIDKVHVSIHFPDRAREVERVIRQVEALAARGVKSGVNLLVARSQLAAAGRTGEALRAAGIGNDRIVYLPMRLQDTPTPTEIAEVAGRTPFQSMTCLSACASSPRFASISWDRQVGWCSYTKTRAPLVTPTFVSLQHALAGLGLTFCGARRALPLLEATP